jgi:hypothetical protein
VPAEIEHVDQLLPDDLALVGLGHGDCLPKARPATMSRLDFLPEQPDRCLPHSHGSRPSAPFILDDSSR